MVRDPIPELKTDLCFLILASFSNPSENVASWMSISQFFPEIGSFKWCQIRDDIEPNDQQVDEKNNVWTLLGKILARRGITWVHKLPSIPVLQNYPKWKLGMVHMNWLNLEEETQKVTPLLNGFSHEWIHDLSRSCTLLYIWLYIKD